MGFASVADTAALSLALLAVGNIAASVLAGRIGSNWPVVFDESGRPGLDPDLTLFQHLALTLTNAAEALATGCAPLAPSALLGLIAAVFPIVLAGLGKLHVGTAALWLAVALTLVEFGSFQIIGMMTV